MAIWRAGFAERLPYMYAGIIIGMASPLSFIHDMLLYLDVFRDCSFRSYGDSYCYRLQ